MQNKSNIVLIGLMGAGKTSIGRQLAKQLKLTFYDSDEEVEKRSGASIRWIFDIEGETGFRLRENKTITDLMNLTNIVLATGGGAVLNPENRKTLASNAIVIYLQASIDTLTERTSRNQRRPLLSHPNPREVLEKLLEQRDPLYREIADLVYSTSANNINKIAEQIVQDLRQQGYFT
jgi:shikimate kinase